MADLLVGAYSSDKAVLLRSRPVIQVSARLEFNVSQIDANRTLCQHKGRKVTCFTVSTCLKYSGKHVSEVIGKFAMPTAPELKKLLIIDDIFSRKIS